MRYLFAFAVVGILSVSACSNTVLTDEFSRERADGKIPVKVELIRKQTEKEINGMLEGEATVERWQEIETDYNACRLSSARSSLSETKEVFADCMSRNGYVYMYRLDAEQLHDEIEAEILAKYAAEKKAIKEKRIAAEKKIEEERIAEEKKAEEKERNSNLILAAEEGNIDKVNQLLREGANVNAVDKWGSTALIDAAFSGNTDIAKALIKAGANVNAKNKGSDTPLLIAILNGNTDIVKALIKAGANVNVADNIGWTPLLYAAQHGHTDIVKALIKAGANVNVADTNIGNTALLYVALFGRTDIAKILIKAGANVNAANIFGSTALLYAAQHGHTDIVKALIKAGANINAVDDNKMTPLLIAILNGNTDIAKVLIKAGADVNAVNNKGETALGLAKEGKHTEIVKMLKAAGAGIAEKKAEEKERDYNLILAAEEGNIDKVNQLLREGANVNTVADSYTPLLYASQNGHTDIVKALIKAGANVNVVEDDGYTPLTWAAQEGYTDIAKALIKAGTNINAVNNKGVTPLIFATFKGYSEIAQMLLECGASPDIRNKKGANAWDFAKDRPIMNVILKRHLAKVQGGWIPQSCKNNAVTISIPPKNINSAAQVFKNSWQHIVVIKQGDNQGSGVIVRPNIVATNCHVVDSGGDISVYKHDNRRASTDTIYNATIQKQDEDKDFCLLYVTNLQGIPAKVRQFSTLQIGENVYAIGSPKGFDLSLSTGVISQLRQGRNNRYIQMDAAISPGSSGGGLFDSESNLIGITTEKIADEDVEGIGFAIPADLVLDIQ